MDSEANAQINSAKKKVPLMSKPVLKRGMTVKFKDNQSLMNIVCKNKEVSMKYAQDKPNNKRSYRTSFVSDSNTKSNPKPTDSSNNKATLPSKAYKFKRVSKVRDKSKSFGGENQSLYSGLRCTKPFEDQNPHTMFGETRKVSPSTMASGQEFVTRNKLKRHTSESMTTK